MSSSEGCGETGEVVAIDEVDEVTGSSSVGILGDCEGPVAFVDISDELVDFGGAGDVIGDVNGDVTGDEDGEESRVDVVDVVDALGDVESGFVGGMIDMMGVLVFVFLSSSFSCVLGKVEVGGGETMMYSG